MDWKIRPESFGGILFSEKLGMTVFVDKDYMKFLGEKESELWNQEKNYLSAPFLFILISPINVPSNVLFVTQTLNQRETED